MRREREKIALQYLRSHRQHDIGVRVKFRETGWDNGVNSGCKNFDYDAIKDETCRYTKTKRFQKHQTKHKAAKHQDFYEGLVTKYLAPISTNSSPSSTVSLPSLSSNPANSIEILPSESSSTGDLGYEAQEMLRIKTKALKSIKKREALLLHLFCKRQSLFLHPKKKRHHLFLFGHQSIHTVPLCFH